MSYKKYIFGVVLIVLSTSILYAQVNFQYNFTLDKPASALNYQITQLFDYNNDSYDDIITQYYDGDQYLQNIIITDLSGTIIDSILIDDWVFYDEYLTTDKAILIRQDDNNVIVRAQIAYPNIKLRLSIQDCETLAYIDSISTFPVSSNSFYEIFLIDIYEYNNEYIYLIGAEEFSFFAKEDPTYSYLYKFKIQNDTLTYIEGYIKSGIKNIHPDNNVLLSVGSYSYASVGSGVSCFSYYYLQKITKNEPNIQTQLHVTSGNVVWEKDDRATYYHYPKNYNIITKNCQDDSPHVLQYRKLDTDDGNSVHFKAYETTSWQEIWTKTDTEIGLGDITSSTCVQVNDEDHYVMYFRGDRLEIRDRITGNIIHHQDSVLAVCDILRKSNGELLFFVEKDDETGYDVYSLDGQIFVSADEPANQGDFFIEQYPNPFRNQITFSFSSQEPIRNAEIKIYNIKGQLVRELRFYASSLSRFHEVSWDGKDEKGNDTAQGIYFYKCSFEDKNIIGKMIKLQ